MIFEGNKYTLIFNLLWFCFLTNMDLGHVHMINVLIITELRLSITFVY